MSICFLFFLTDGFRGKALHRRKKKKSPITIKKKKTIAITIKKIKSGNIKSKISIYWQIFKSKKIVVVSHGTNLINSELGKMTNELVQIKNFDFEIWQISVIFLHEFVNFAPAAQFFGQFLHILTIYRK
jgi:hypothetical protein